MAHGYTQSQIDPCLFMKQGIICSCYVDDTIFAGADPDVLEAEIQSLGVNNKEQRHTFELHNEGEVGAFLGIQIKKTGPQEYYLTQTGLIKKMLDSTGMSDCNGVDTPATTTPIGIDVNGDPFSESWQ